MTGFHGFYRVSGSICSSVGGISPRGTVLLSPFLSCAVLQLRLLFVLESEDDLRGGVFEGLEHCWDCAHGERWN